MKISFNKLNGQSDKEKKNVLEAINRVIDSGYYVMGPEAKKFEASFALYIGTRHGIGVGNGLEALQISLMALGIGSGDEVITTPFSAVATTLVIRAVGAKPVFVDIDDFYHINASKIESVITPKTKAIMPVHLYGQPVDMDTIMSVAKKHKLFIIEDCAQAHGAEYKDKKVGSFGIFGCFSFYPTKNLGAIGEGGFITTDDDNLAEKCRMIRNYGQKNRYEHEICGINARIDELQSAILSEKFKYLDKNNARRQEIANIYLKELSGIKGLTLPKRRDDVAHVQHLFVIEIDNRDALQNYLKEKGIDTLIHYPIPIHKQKCLAEFNKIKLPIVEEKVNRILSLPMHPYLTNEEVIYVCKEIKSFLKA